MLDLLEDLEKAVLSENLFETYEIVEKIKKEQEPFEYVAPMFRLMEENPELDFGLPGPMVDFIESSYEKGYKNLLLESVRRKPMGYTIWMINRIMNISDLRDKQMYMDILRETLDRNDIDEVLRDRINEYIDYQKQKDSHLK
ncbi:MAG: hypothetical protein K2G55_17700 [Lachnospiraceae bacterium]|nr:hypothetical protein [Lachnospiraceae bacterium]